MSRNIVSEWSFLKNRDALYSSLSSGIKKDLFYLFGNHRYEDIVPHIYGVCEVHNSLHKMFPDYVEINPDYQELCTIIYLSMLEGKLSEFQLYEAYGHVMNSISRDYQKYGYDYRIVFREMIKFLSDTWSITYEGILNKPDLTEDEEVIFNVLIDSGIIDEELLSTPDGISLVKKIVSDCISPEDLEGYCSQINRTFRKVIGSRPVRENKISYIQDAIAFYQKKSEPDEMTEFPF